MIALQGLEGYVAGQVIAVPDHGMRIGQRRDNDLVLEDPTVSRQHAELQPRDDGLHLVDLESTNGTFVNGIQISDVVLHHGDAIQMGDCVFRYRDRPEPLLVDDSEAATAPRQVQATQIVRPPEGRATVVRRQTETVLKRVGGSEAARAMPALAKLTQEAARVDSVEEILELVLKLVFEVVDVQRGAILLIDDLLRQPTHTAVLYRGQQSRRGVRDMPISSTLARRVISDNTALLIPDARLDPVLAQRASIVQHGIRCAAYVPMVSEDHTIGLLCVDTNVPNGLTETQLQVLTAFANHATLTVERVRLKEELAHEIKTRMGLQRYVSPQVADELIRHGGDMPASGEAEVTVLFADITGFTPLSEQLQPAEVCGLLNAVFEALTQVVFRFGGTVDKYIGDCIMALWGAPFQDPLHPARATVAAVEMVRALEEAKHSWSPKYAGITLGVAINSGEVTVGNIGSDLVRQWTAIGDVVNVAARIEDLAGANEIMVSAAVAPKVQQYVELRSIGPHSLKGKQEQVELFQVVGVKDPQCFDQLSLADGVLSIG